MSRLGELRALSEMGEKIDGLTHSAVFIGNRCVLSITASLDVPPKSYFGHVQITGKEAGAVPYFVQWRAKVRAPLFVQPGEVTLDANVVLKQCFQFIVEAMEPKYLEGILAYPNGETHDLLQITETPIDVHSKILDVSVPKSQFNTIESITISTSDGSLVRKIHVVP